MIQDIYPHKLNNSYKIEATVTDNDHVMCFVKDKLLIDVKAYEAGELVLPTVSMMGSDRSYTFLFCLDEENIFLTEAGLLEDVPDGYDFMPIREVRKSGIRPQELIFAALTAKHLSDWYRDNKFCGRCAGKMFHAKNERAMQCSICSYTSYPRIMPACIIGIKNGDRILITKYNKGYANSALVAGFTEIGETAEETVIRESMEETGLKVKNITYYKSQPWGIANDLLLGFFCDVDGDDTIIMDESELKYAEWVKREDIILQPDNFSLTNEMMTLFKEGKI